MGLPALAQTNSVALSSPAPVNAKRDLPQLVRIAHQRLYPSLTNPNFLVLHSRRLIFEKWIAHWGDASLTILDIGGRYQPYRPLFDPVEHKYIACDLLKTGLVNVMASGEALPFASETFDVVICTQVFEYFARPHVAADEIRRVLKPGGSLLMSVASCAPAFVPEERWRYTRGGVQSLLSPFRQVTIVAETSSMGGLLRTLNLGLHSLTPFSFLRKIIEWTVCPALNLAGLCFEKLKLTANDQFTANYSVLATK